MSTPHLTDEQLSAHIDGALEREEQTAVASHLGACADCTARVDLLRATTQAVATLPPTEMPRPLDLGFLRESTAPARAEASRRGFVARIIHGRPPVWLPTAVAAAAVLVLAVDIGPRLLPAGGRVTETSAGQGAGPTASRSDQHNFAAPAPPGTNPSVNGAAPGSSALKSGDQAATKSAAGPDGSTVTLAANPPTASSGHPTQVALVLVGAPPGTSLGQSGMELVVSQGANQARLAGSVGAGRQVKAGEHLDLTATWTAGAVFGPPAPGSYTLIGRVFFADGRLVEVSLSFSVGPG
jgi:hypothetical protein